MKLRIYIYPDGPSVEQIYSRLDDLNPPLSDPIKKQVHMFALQIFGRIESMQEMSSPSSFIQNQTIADNNHTIILQGRMNPPSFWQVTMGKIFG